ncbi:hypothetical protein ELI02_05285 [Rhizobium leguminosarum]|uniref:Uncharacterized protein n=1 Tax=Rhizobium leguminosarum TaxID=384 RepID=A0A4Q8XWI0_RHILE|nr:hypothetical protein ELI32_04285 [Rhizobium leguminosarum]TAV57079.1 hypothetical protein ELI31_04285 [Rhizobium leguminosarum]TAV68017.1 hypothetical protein ELI30_04285 [Rhizobium leguminosarum]TAV88484.1 hypothetical protein ELI22_04280 [Rhizobium leguminosarum]TAV93063.1 hypothetical protein ELI21_04265 [Rhizobium leguminosarum]
MVDAQEARGDFARWDYPRWWGIVARGMEILSAVLIALPVSSIVGVAPAATENPFSIPSHRFCHRSVGDFFCHL